MKDKEQEKALEAESIHVGVRYPLFEFFSKEHNLTLLDSEIDDVINVVNKWQQSQQPKPAKSLQECKDEVARKYKYENWKALSSGFKSYHGLQFVENRFNEAAELYASQREEQAVKVALEMAADKGEGEITICNEHAYLYCAKIDKQSILSLAPQVLEKLKEERK